MNAPAQFSIPTARSSFAVFADFDGTIARDDLGDKLFVDFGDFAGCYPRLASGEWTVAEYWRAVVASLPAEITLERIKLWAIEQAADSHFADFVSFCGGEGVPVAVVSDGFDAYIKPVLEREGASAGATVFCNRLEELPEGGLVPMFWGASESCSCFCASCKRNAVLSVAVPEALIVYIGDGYSDFCAAEHADIIFAKGALAAYCNRNRLPHYPFSSFADVTAVLRTLLNKKRLKPRHQAFLKRKSAFETE